MAEMCGGNLKLYSNVSASKVSWLWYPYIPFGKVTLIQGDPGCGKSTLMMHLIAGISTGGAAPNGTEYGKPMHVVYQCSEDGVSDTIKPRLTAAGADCRNVAFLDEDALWLSMDNEAIRQAMEEFHARLFVLDPFQSYLGDTDMANVGKMRKMLRQLASWASQYGCAVVLVGHLSKNEGAKDLYRGLGSIDIAAAARSVLHLGYMEDDSTVCRVHHVKSSLARKGGDMYFRINRDQRVEWLDSEEAGELEMDGPPAEDRRSKQEQAADLLEIILADGPVKATEVSEIFRNADICSRTVLIAKKNMDIQSVKKDGVWYWQLPGFGYSERKGGTA